RCSVKDNRVRTHDVRGAAFEVRRVGEHLPTLCLQIRQFGAAAKFLGKKSIFLNRCHHFSPTTRTPIERKSQPCGRNLKQRPAFAKRDARWPVQSVADRKHLTRISRYRVNGSQTNAGVAGDGAGTVVPIWERNPKKSARIRLVVDLDCVVVGVGTFERDEPVFSGEWATQKDTLAHHAIMERAHVIATIEPKSDVEPVRKALALISRRERQIHSGLIAQKDHVAVPDELAHSEVPLVKIGGALGHSYVEMDVIEVHGQGAGDLDCSGKFYKILASRPPRTRVPGSAPVDLPSSNVTSPDLTV